MTDGPSWQITGEWFDNCSCAVTCPCHLCSTSRQRLLRVGPLLARPAWPVRLHLSRRMIESGLKVECDIVTDQRNGRLLRAPLSDTIILLP
jgi:hypothetical protein